MSSEKSFAHLHIKSYGLWDLYLHENQHYLGRTYAWLRRDGRMHLWEITPNERDEFFDVVLCEVHEALSWLFHWDELVDLLNVAWLGNNESHGHHGHFHLIPRYLQPPSLNGVEWEADLRWGKNYAPYPKKEIAEKTFFSIRDSFRKLLK